MTLSDLAFFYDTERRAASLPQLSFMCFTVIYSTACWYVFAIVTRVNVNPRAAFLPSCWTSLLYLVRNMSFSRFAHRAKLKRVQSRLMWQKFSPFSSCEHADSFRMHKLLNPRTAFMGKETPAAQFFSYKKLFMVGPGRFMIFPGYRRGTTCNNHVADRCTGICLAWRQRSNGYG